MSLTHPTDNGFSRCHSGWSSDTENGPCLADGGEGRPLHGMSRYEIAVGVKHWVRREPGSSR